VDRLLVVRCPDLLVEDEGGSTLRTFAKILTAIEAYCPWVTPVRPGICSLPARGPARYFGGEEALVDLVYDAASSVTPAEVGIADGLFAAVLAARRGQIVPAGETAAFLAPLPVGILGQPELAELLDRLGIRTLGGFAALPDADILGRFGADGAHGHRVAGGRSGELADLRQPRLAGLLAGDGAPDAHGVAQVGFWGGVNDVDARAARCLAVVQELLGPDGVVTAHLQGGRNPAEQSRLVTWTTGIRPVGTTSRPGQAGAPWPGRIPPPAPAVVHPNPVRVSARGLLTATPDRLSIEGGPWEPLSGWAGPWPADERWWSRSRRRGARLQAVTARSAHLLLVERGRWWVEATYG
jgi:nucleotidyltransferase/DNA polymerase involved in DNA repair